MSEFKKVNLTSSDVISDAGKSLVDFIMEARKAALKEEIRANTVLIDETFAKVNDIHFLSGGDILHIPPMICGLEVRLTDELPNGYNFALVEAPGTERERIVKQVKSEVTREIFEEIENLLKIVVLPCINEEGCITPLRASYWSIDPNDFAQLKKKYMEGELI